MIYIMLPGLMIFGTKITEFHGKLRLKTIQVPSRREKRMKSAMRPLLLRSILNPVVLNINSMASILFQLFPMAYCNHKSISLFNIAIAFFICFAFVFFQSTCTNLNIFPVQFDTQCESDSNLIHHHRPTLSTRADSPYQFSSIKFSSMLNRPSRSSTRLEWTPTSTRYSPSPPRNAATDLLFFLKVVVQLHQLLLYLLRQTP
jgi:hypothetical protein